LIPISYLPTVNAVLNATSAVLLATGYGFIRRRAVPAHRLCMLSAFVVSALFLTSYLIYHYHTGATAFTGEGWVRPVYFTLLISHIILAVLIVPLALVTLYRALGEEFTRHRRLARWTFPLWMYVSVSGVLIYWMLYHLYAPL
jgi:putative membrane protein